MMKRIRVFVRNAELNPILCGDDYCNEEELCPYLFRETGPKRLFCMAFRIPLSSTGDGDPRRCNQCKEITR